MKFIPSYIRNRIRAYLAPDLALGMSPKLWRRLLMELRCRSGGVRESGAFLLGKVCPDGRTVHHFVPYDDLDPTCLDTGYVVFKGKAFGRLWDECDRLGMRVVADIHCHPEEAFLSETDRLHPMISQVGHVAIVVPDYASRDSTVRDVGVYEYEGSHQWRRFEPGSGQKKLYIGRFA